MTANKHLGRLIILSLLFIFLISESVKSQVTTSRLTGIVHSPKGEPLQDANVTIEFAEAGIKELRFTRKDGRFIVSNLSAGGPYRVNVTHISCLPVTYDSVYLELGSNNEMNIRLSERTNSLNEVTITSRSSVFDNKKTGAATGITSRQLKLMPTISRSADDFLRFSPSASGNYNGMSFAGRNGQFNGFSMDGAVFNNPFGLDAPPPGGQTNAQAISLDAIDQIQVNLAPFDVTQAGFTGAGVNTVTKSGRNSSAGTIYGFYRNQNMTGSKVDGNKFAIPNLSHFQGGASFGGPIIKNKLFYFVNVETEQRTDEASAYRARYNGNAGLPNTSRVLEEDLIDVRNILRTRYGYETGPYQGYSHDQVNYKWLAKFDWNINSIHKLSLTYNGLDAYKEKPAHPSALGRRGPDYITMQYQNAGYKIVNKINSLSTELKSNWDNDVSNKLRIVYTAFNDNRAPFSDPFPIINITKYGVRYIIGGHEPFSIHNSLDQHAFQITDNFTFTKNKHTFTAGLSYESFKFNNSFNLTGYGTSIFGDIDIQTFRDSVPAGGAVYGTGTLDAEVDYANNRATADKWNSFNMSVATISAYMQDELQITEKLKLTYGLRIDYSKFYKGEYRNPNINSDGTYAGSFSVGEPTLPNNDPLVLYDANGNLIQNGTGKDVDNTKLPKNTLISPRLGFNWDAKGNKTLQIRGGTGLFAGRFPFVWVANQIGNPSSSYYNVTDPSFSFPQVWRSNLGTDIKLPSGTILTFDAMYTKDIKAVVVRNYKLSKPSGILNSGTGDNRSIFTSADMGASNTYVFENINKGYQFNFTTQLQRSFKKGFQFMGAYNFLIAKDVNSISAEISGDAFDRNPILNNPNQPVLSPSLYGNKHRFITTMSKRYEYGKDKSMATSFAIFGSWTSGNRYAYVYSGDINKDGAGSNDLMYVPTDAEIDVMNFTTLVDINGNTQDALTQRAAFKGFIAQDKYLNTRRGQFTEKYGAETPWFSQLDMRIMQDFKIKKTANTLQLSLDIINLGNMLNSKWGVKKYATTSGYYQPVSVSLDNANTPTYQFDTNQKSTFSPSPDLQSRWQMQFGIRYIF